MILISGLVTMILAWIYCRLTNGHVVGGFAFIVGLITTLVGAMRLAYLYTPL